MSKKEKVFSVMSRQDSKSFANEYLINKIRNNYQLIPGFNLEPVVENKVVVDDNLENNNVFAPKETTPNPSYTVDANTNIDQNNVINENQNLAYYEENVTDSNVTYYNQNTNNIESKENQNVFTDTLNGINEIKNSVLTNKNYANELNFNNLSSSSNYNNENHYSQNVGNKDYSDNLNDYYEETYQEIVNNNNYIKEHSNGLSSWNMEKNKEYELKDDSFEIEESENLQSLLNDYNMNKNILKEDSFDDDTYFSYLSKKKIKTIISEKLGYCDEEMLDEVHSKAISENWKELDVQKWLLNPENINRFKEMDYDKTIDYPINFSSSEIDKSLFDLSEKHLDSVNNDSNDDKLINFPVGDNDNEDEHKINNHHKKHHDEHDKTEGFNKDHHHHNHCDTKHHHCECKQKNINDSFTNDILVLKNHEISCNCKKDFNKPCEKNTIDEIKSNQKLFEKEISNKFDILNNQIQNMSGNFKATLVDESYRKLLFDNQTETIKNYLNERILNSQFPSSSFSKIREINSSLNNENVLNSNNGFYFDKRNKKNSKNQKYNNHVISKKTDYLNNAHNQKVLHLRINELNKKMDYEIGEINSTLSKWEKSSITELNELKSIISEISNKLDSANNQTEKEKFNKDDEFLFNEFKRSESFSKDYTVENFSSEDDKSLLTEIVNKNKEEIISFYEDKNKLSKQKAENNVEIIINPIDFSNKNYDSNDFDLQEKSKEFFKNSVYDVFGYNNEKDLFSEIKEPTKINFLDSFESEEKKENNENDEEFLNLEEENEFKKDDSFAPQINPIEFEEEKNNDEEISEEVLVLKDFEFIIHEFKNSSFIGVEKIKENEFHETTLVAKNYVPSAEELYKITNKDHEINRINANFLFEEFNGPEYIEPVKKIVKTVELFISLKIKNYVPLENELYKISEKDHQENKIKNNFLFEEFNGPEYIEPVNKKKEAPKIINFSDSLVAGKVSDFNENGSDHNILFDEDFNSSQYDVFEEKINQEIDLTTSDLLEKSDNLINDNNLSKDFAVKEKDYEINLNLVDLSNKEINEFDSKKTEDISFLDEQNLNVIDLSETQNQENKNEVEVSIPENIETVNIDFENNDVSNSIKTNEKDSQNLENNNYNFTLDKLKKERQEKISKELIDNSEKFIDKIKENVTNELDDVIKGLEDLNINDDSIYDIENIKIKFKNI